MVKNQKETFLLRRGPLMYTRLSLNSSGQGFLRERTNRTFIIYKG